MSSVKKDRSGEVRYDGNSSASITTVSSESVAISAGAAGSLVSFQIAKFPIRNSLGGGLGSFGDSSFSFASGVFTNEVAFGTEDADLENGDFWINYITGEGRGKKATTGTSASATYKTITTSTATSTESAPMQARGTEDVAGADTYTTLLTPAADATHIMVSLGGSSDAIISLDGGTTEHFVVVANSQVVLDGVSISSGVAIQGKNKTGGANYANLNVSVW